MTVATCTQSREKGARSLDENFSHFAIGNRFNMNA